MTPSDLDLIENFSLPPNKIIFKAFFGIFLIGSSSEKLYFSEIVLICLNAQLLFFRPKGKIPPLLIVKFSSGIIFSTFTIFLYPKPLQDLHIPLGELKEKLFGSGFLYDIPVSGHISSLLKNFK